MTINKHQKPQSNPYFHKSIPEISERFKITIVSDHILSQSLSKTKGNPNIDLPNSKSKILEFLTQFDFSPSFSKNCLQLQKTYSSSTDIPIFHYKELLDSLRDIQKSYPITEYDYPKSVSKFKTEWLLLKLRDEYKQIEHTSKRISLKSLSPDSQRVVLTLDSQARIGDPFFLLEDSIFLLDKIPKSKAYFENNGISIEFSDNNKPLRHAIDLSQKGEIYPESPPSYSPLRNTLTLGELFSQYNVVPVTKPYFLESRFALFGREYSSPDLVLQSATHFLGYSLTKINGQYHINKKRPTNFDNSDIASFMLATLPHSITQMFNHDRELLRDRRQDNNKSALRRMPFYIQKIEKDFRESLNSKKLQKLEISQLDEIGLSLYCLHFSLPALAQILFLRKEQLSSLIQKHFENCVLEVVDTKLGDGSTESTFNIHLDGGPLLLRQSINLELTRRLLKSR